MSRSSVSGAYDSNTTADAEAASTTACCAVRSVCRLGRYSAMYTTDASAADASTSMVSAEDADTSTTASSAVIDSTAAAFAAALVVTFASLATLVKSSAALSNSARNGSVEL